MPNLDFSVVEADAVPYAAGPTILFKLRVSNDDPEEQIHSVILRAQIRIEPTLRQYEAGEEARLRELFGEPHRWGTTLRSLLWTHAVVVVPGFNDASIIEMPIPCTYDFEVAAAKYFYAVENGEVPLIFLFSGTIFYSRDGGAMQISQIPWEKEAKFRLPVRLWKEMIEHYFPGSAWLRIRKDIFDRLYEYRTTRGLPTWEDALERLLAEPAAGKER